MDHTVTQKCYPRRFRMSTFFHKLPQSNFVFIVNNKYYYNKPTNLFCSHWFKPKAHRSSMPKATQKTKETQTNASTWEIVDILNNASTDQLVSLIIFNNWGSLIRKILNIFKKQHLARLLMNHMKNYAWMTKAMKKEGPEQK